MKTTRVVGADVVSAPRARRRLASLRAVMVAAGAGFVNAHPPLWSRGFCLRGRPRDGLHVDVQERFLLVALLLVQLAHPDDLAQNLDVEAVPLGLEVDLLLAFVELLDLLVDVLDTLDDRSQLVARNVSRSAHGLLPVKVTRQKSAIPGSPSSRAGQRGNQLLNATSVMHASRRGRASCGRYLVNGSNGGSPT